MQAESKVSDFFALLKPRVMSLVVFTGLVGMIVAPGHLHIVTSFVTILCIALGSGASGAINMWYERDIDQIMKRTKLRPLPRKVIDPTEALHFGVALCFASVIIMALFVNYMAAFLLAFAILFYVFIYTIWLKRRTGQNIVIGGAAGALPPMIGWAAVTGGVSVESFILFLIIFIWTPPHFWALSLYKSDDYALAGIPMMPVVKGEKYTKFQILAYSILLVATTIIPYLIGMFGSLYLYVAAFLGAVFLLLAFCLYRSPDNRFAPKLFGYSIIYLFILFLVMLADRFL